MRHAMSTVALAIGVLASACSPGRFGEPCGGGQTGEAFAVLSDTSTYGGDTVLAHFVQHDTDEFTELAVFARRPEQRVDGRPAPRVVVRRNAGRVFIDMTTSVYDPANLYRVPWQAHTVITSADARLSLYGAFEDGALVVELWAPGDTVPSTVGSFTTTRLGVMPVLRCV